MERKPDAMTWETTREQTERQEREQTELARLVGAVEGLARTKDGLHFLHWLIDISGFLQEVPPMAEVLMAHYEGRRTIGKHVFELIKKAHCIEAVCQEDTLNG